MINGLRRGFVLQAFRVLGSILALVVAFRFSPELAGSLKGWLPLPALQTDTSPSWLSFLPFDLFLYRIAAFILLFFVTRLIVRYLARLLNRVVRLPVLNTVNRVAGLILALVQITLILLIAINIMQFIPGPKMQSLIQESWIAAGILNLTPFLTEWLQEWLKLPINE